MKNLAEQIIQVIKPNDIDADIFLHEPFFAGNEKQYLNQCIDTGYVSIIGEFVNKFEEKLAELTQAKYAVATSCGASALHTSFILAGVQSGDEVLTPSLTFISTSNAISYCGATPHFVDVEARSLGVCPDKLADYLAEIIEVQDGVSINKNTRKPIRALCVTHIFGHPCKLSELKQICDDYQLKLIEDAAEALGSFYHDQHVGHYGFAGILSFNGNKIVTTGGGGAILTDDAEIAKRAKHITTVAKVPHKWQYDHDAIGYNYRMPNINAALGLAQLEQLQNIIELKRNLAHYYQDQFAKLDEVTVLSEPSYARSNYWLNAIILSAETKEQFEDIINQCYANHIQVRPVWKLHHQLAIYQDCPRMNLECSEDLVSRIINIPSSPALAID